MLNKKLVKDIQSLVHKKLRDEAELFVVEGPKIVSELAALVPAHVQQIYATDEFIAAHPHIQKVVPVTEAELERISFLKTPHQVLAVVRQFDAAAPPSGAFTMFLDGIQDPGNFGTIVRIADWFGVKNIVCAAGCADLYNPKVVQSTMSSVARVNVFYDEDDSWIRGRHDVIYAATLHGRSVYEEPKSRKGILMIGNESKGLRKEMIALATNEISIPKKGGAESLNAAVAAGIILSYLT